MPVRRPTLTSAGRLSILFAVALAAAACVPDAGTAASPTPSLAPTTAPAENPYAGGSAAVGSGNGRKIGYVSYGEQVEFVAQVSAGVRSQAAAAGFELVECDLGVDTNKIPGCLRKLADAGVVGAILFEPRLADPTIACAGLPANIPVVAIEEPQPCATVLVRADDLRAGQIAGAAVGAFVQKNWSCQFDAWLSLESTTAATRSQLRMEGYRQGFTSVCSAGIQNPLIAQRGDTFSGGQAATAEVLTQHAGKTKILVVGVNDEAIRGALDAVTTAGRTADVFFSGQGLDMAARAAFRTNAQWLGDSAYFPERYGATVIPALTDLLAGRTVANELLVAPQFVDASNIGTVYP